MRRGKCKNMHKTYMCETKEMARFAKALAHPARIKIMKYLSQSDSCFTGDFVEVLPLAQSTVSQHLKELKDAGLLIAYETPPKVRYCINQDNWERAKTLFYEFFDPDYDFKKKNEEIL
jgi:ArsR family transcriptional regulator